MAINVAEALKPIIEVQPKTEEWLRIPVPAALVGMLDLGGLEATLGLPIDQLFTSRLSKNGRRYFVAPGLWEIQGEVHIFFGFEEGEIQSIPLTGAALIKQEGDLLLPIGNYLLPVWPGRLDRGDFGLMPPLVTVADLSIPELPRGSGGGSNPKMIDVVKEALSQEGHATLIMTAYPVELDGKFPRYLIQGALNDRTGSWQCSGGLGKKLLACYALNGDTPISLKVDHGSLGEYVAF